MYNKFSIYKNKMFSLIAQLLCWIFQPFLITKNKMLNIKQKEGNYIINLSHIMFVLSFTLIGISYSNVALNKNVFYKLLSILDLASINCNRITAYMFSLITFANIGHYFGDATTKIYCYIKFGNPYLYLNAQQLENIANACIKKGYSNINKEILSEIIKFCIKNSKFKQSNILGSKPIDWKYTIDHLMRSDLEFFLSQQQALRSKRSEIIKKIASFYIYHQECHNKIELQNKEKLPLLKTTLLKTTFTETAEKTEKTSNESTTSESSSNSKIQDNANNTSHELTPLNTSFDTRATLLKILESKEKNLEINLDSIKKEYRMFKSKYLENNKNNIYTSEYTEYMLLDEYERNLYSKAEEISRGIFPTEIVSKIKFNSMVSSLTNTSANISKSHSRDIETYNEMFLNYRNSSFNSIFTENKGDKVNPTDQTQNYSFNYKSFSNKPRPN